MYWHLGVAVDNADAAKDDLYIDVYILDANPAVSNGIVWGIRLAPRELNCECVNGR